jgi:hypothetical protein
LWYILIPPVHELDYVTGRTKSYNKLLMIKCWIRNVKKLCTLPKQKNSIPLDATSSLSVPDCNQGGLKKKGNQVE